MTSSAAAWPVRTARATIRSVEPADLSALYDIVTLPEVSRMLFLFRPGMERAEFLEHFPVHTATPPFRAVIALDGRCVGSIGVGSGHAPPIWYFLDPSVAGQGIASEIVLAFVAWLDAAFHLDALEAGVFTDNPASRRVLEKAGFTLVGEEDFQSAARPAPAPVWQFRR